MTYDVVIVGGGLSGLTAAAYLSQAGLKVILYKKKKRLEGLLVALIAVDSSLMLVPEQLKTLAF